MNTNKKNRNSIITPTHTHNRTKVTIFDKHVKVSIYYSMYRTAPKKNTHKYLNTSIKSTKEIYFIIDVAAVKMK